ncbi:MAG: hypothetical protein K2H49_07785, partial [Muribaculaceae bacterium]|nr:hypothetical protein [Muribaculaceae bacterium]
MASSPQQRREANSSLIIKKVLCGFACDHYVFSVIAPKKPCPPYVGLSILLPHAKPQSFFKRNYQLTSRLGSGKLAKISGCYASPGVRKAQRVNADSPQRHKSQGSM